MCNRVASRINSQNPAESVASNSPPNILPHGHTDGRDIDNWELTFKEQARLD